MATKNHIVTFNIQTSDLTMVYNIIILLLIFKIIYLYMGLYFFVLL